MQHGHLVHLMNKAVDVMVDVYVADDAGTVTLSQEDLDSLFQLQATTSQLQATTSLQEVSPPLAQPMETGKSKDADRNPNLQPTTPIEPEASSPSALPVEIDADLASILTQTTTPTTVIEDEASGPSVLSMETGGDHDSDSGRSEVFEFQTPTGRPRPTSFTPIGDAEPEKKASRRQVAVRRRYYRRSETLFRKLAEMNTQTGWKGFLLLSNPDGTEYVYGGDVAMTDRFLEQQPLTDTKPTPQNSSRVSLSKVMDKVISSGKSKKVCDLVLETPEKLATPLPTSNSQQRALRSLNFSADEGETFSVLKEKVFIREKKKQDPKRKLQTIYEQKKTASVSKSKKKK